MTIQDISKMGYEREIEVVIVPPLAPFFSRRLILTDEPGLEALNRTLDRQWRRCSRATVNASLMGVDA